MRQHFRCVAWIVCLLAVSNALDLDFLLQFEPPRAGGVLEATDPTAEPTAEPSAAPTAEPSAEPTLFHAPTTTPTAIPTSSPVPTAVPSAEPTAYHAQYVYFEASLGLSNATSNVLDATASTILEESVAETTGVPVSAVALLSYEAVLLAGPSSLNQHQGQANTAASAWFDRTFHPTVKSLRHADSQEDTRYHRKLANANYDILAQFGIRALMTDFPQYGSNATALYVALATALTAAAGDDDLQQSIVAKSITANSQTFAYLSTVDVTNISPLVEEAYPTSMPTYVPLNHASQGGRSEAPYSEGEMAGIIIAAMIGIGLFVLLLHYFLIRRRKPVPEEYILYQPYDTPTATTPAAAAGTEGAGRNHPDHREQSAAGSSEGDFDLRWTRPNPTAPSTATKVTKPTATGANYRTQQTRTHTGYTTTSSNRDGGGQRDRRGGEVARFGNPDVDVAL